MMKEMKKKKVILILKCVAVNKRLKNYAFFILETSQLVQIALR